ncbi:negative cofactor 2 transcription regulator complex subunit ncb2 [Linnemannia elongata]|uniref:Negative cofactor 2 transcription regulator complex subunit ncb2 n=2 Tax=Linnemannia TaxID=2779861 RepID=A0A9P6RIM7_9FUNG|nr:negative cofactor 2 transcription regulator complex subunit ncb2 [Haplosporangium gracile]KAF9329293.1 negative cofactor 2 transcription regulator complex subunit ncb2 [Linnemannia elongata]KAG0059778.1 negative cofactor 2 transcription regulator complex subunit ncb2 [Linnemannia elongata]KAG0319875.1 negative cofactor 2 transcription regulator complex subunit ncb2 [Linnemannia gamsii]OAQ26895.1 histone-fold-containing protein [Linnemannia elongata AG-77]
MSDNERGGPEDDLSLPKATVQKLINEMMPDDIACAKDTRDLLIDCCVEFIHLLASEANEICEKETKKTIAAEHVITALKALGFDAYLPEVEVVLQDHKTQQKVKDKDKKSGRLENSGRSEEELLSEQLRLLAEAKERFRTQQQ